MKRTSYSVLLVAVYLLSIANFSSPLLAQAAPAQDLPSKEDLYRQIQDLTARIVTLEKTIATMQGGSASTANSEKVAQDLNLATHALIATAPVTDAPPQKSSSLPVTFNFTFDGYYSYNFAEPYNHTNALRVYDISHNSFSVNQAAAIFELPPDISAGRRIGVRADLLWGQATDVLQGNTLNETRTGAYRNLFQAYGTYVFPTKNLLSTDFGKWSSTLGIEGTYSKDQANYSRSYLFSMLPFYHMGFRTSYVTSKASFSGWLCNGLQQTDDFNGFKSTAFLTSFKPTSSLVWSLNYYTGQEQASTVQGATVVKPNGREHIVDTYAIWNATKKLTLSTEGDYVINRVYQNSEPSHVLGGAAYAQYVTSPRTTLTIRGEYVSDRNGFLSGTNQALKEVTTTFDYKLADGFITRMEYRRDWSNQPYFTTARIGTLAQNQDTATLGLIWWYGGKQGSW